MDIKIICKDENYEKYKLILEKAGFQISEEANLILKESNYQPTYFVGKILDHFEMIPYEKVVFIESFGRDIYLYTENATYQIKQKLYEIEGEFAEFGFIRINKSQIVNKAFIGKIKPLLNSKIKIFLKTHQVLEISRSYQEHFKETIGF